MEQAKMASLETRCLLVLCDRLLWFMTGLAAKYASGDEADIKEQSDRTQDPRSVSGFASSMRIVFLIHR
jgi:hypothetical protein